MDRLKQLARSPEIAVPVGVLAVALVIVGLTLLVLKPDPTIGAALIAAVAGVYGTVLSLILSRYYERQKDDARRTEELDREARAKKIRSMRSSSRSGSMRSSPRA